MISENLVDLSEYMYHFSRSFIRPTSGGAVRRSMLEREVPGLNLGHACRPSRSEFSVVFSENDVNTA